MIFYLKKPNCISLLVFDSFKPTQMLSQLKQFTCCFQKWDVSHSRKNIQHVQAAERRLSELLLPCCPDWWLTRLMQEDLKPLEKKTEKVKQPDRQVNSRQQKRHQTMTHENQQGVSRKEYIWSTLVSVFRRVLFLPPLPCADMRRAVCCEQSQRIH